MQEKKIEPLCHFTFLFSLMLAVLLAALDQTIVATALPKISSDFDASDEIGWVCTIFFQSILCDSCHN